MNREQIAKFIAAINSAQQFVPPVIFAGISESPIAAQLAAIANGIVVCELKPLVPEPAQSSLDDKADDADG